MTTSTATDNHLEPVIRNFEFSMDYLRKAVVDIPDEDMASQSEGVVNHPAWNLAHLAMANDAAVGMLGLQPLAPKDWSERFGMGSNPTPVRDEYPSKAEALDILNRQAEAIVGTLRTVSNESLEGENPFESMRDIAPTLRDAITFFLTTHVGMHLGQVAAWRTANDLPRVLG